MPMPRSMPKFTLLAFPEASPTDRLARVILPPKHVWVRDVQDEETGGPQEPGQPEQAQEPEQPELPPAG